MLVTDHRPLEKLGKVHTKTLNRLHESFFKGEKEDSCEHERMRTEGGSSENVCELDDDTVGVRVCVRRARKIYNGYVLR
jgi:hypothetical protein